MTIPTGLSAPAIEGLTAKHAIRHLLKRNYGRVLLIASIAGAIGLRTVDFQ